ncbi:MAG: hypothetical protein ACFE9S_09195 [Candidatus Hermodarchaeota archaeon]
MLSLKSYVEVYERNLPEIKSRIRALMLERENFQNKWLHHADLERFINEKSLKLMELNFITTYLKYST